MPNEQKRFQVKKFLFETDHGEPVCFALLTDRLLPMVIPNEYLLEIGNRKKSTGRVYAYKLCVFFNYLDGKGVEYENADNRHVRGFIDRLVYGDYGNLVLPVKRQTLNKSTLAGYIGVITSFYRWFDVNYGSAMVFHETERKVHPKSYLYGQIYSKSYRFLVMRILPDTGGKREYIKWYTEEEKAKLCRSFRTLRDEAVFRLTLEGFRIDEVLSMRIGDYDPTEKTIRPSRSKRKTDAEAGQENHLRVVRLDDETCRVLDRYLAEERIPAENESRQISEVIFMNLNRGKNFWKPLRYDNFRRILRSTARRAGMDEAKVRTHSGRSTHVMDILEFNAQNPDKAYSEIEIRQIFGWSSLDSMKPYTDTENEILAMAAAKRRKEYDDD